MKAFKLTLKKVISTLALSCVLILSLTTTFPAFAEENTMLNINHATLEQLQEIKGIGNKKAQAIIQYRSENGKFETIEDLVNVKGIGKVFIEKNKQWLAVN